jgi:hypothetical protein
MTIDSSTTIDSAHYMLSRPQRLLQLVLKCLGLIRHIGPKDLLDEIPRTRAQSARGKGRRLNGHNMASHTRSATDGPARAPSQVSFSASRRSTNIVSRASLFIEKLSITRTALGWQKPVRYKKSVFGLYGYGMSNDEYACGAAVSTTADLQEPELVTCIAPVQLQSPELTGQVKGLQVRGVGSGIRPP